MLLNITGPSYKTKSVIENPQQCINWYPVEDKHEGLATLVLYPTPGARPWIDFGGTSVRCLTLTQAGLFVVVDSKIILVTGSISSPTYTTIGNLTTTSGTVKAAALTNAGVTQVIWCDGTQAAYYSTSGPTFTTPIGGGVFPNTATQITTMQGYFIVGVPNSTKFYTSNINDGTTWQSVAFQNYNIVGRDLLGCLYAYRSTLYLLGATSTGLYYNSGTGTNPFLPIQGISFEFGTTVPTSIADGDNSLYYLVTDKNGGAQVIKVIGYTSTIITDRATATEFSSYYVDDAIGFCYQQEGHEFYVITFPTQNKTWVYDITTNMWHQRDTFNGQVFNRHLANCHAFWNNTHLIGDWQSGQVFIWDLNYFKDNQQLIRRYRVTPTLFKENKRLTIFNYELIWDNTQALSSGQGFDPQCIVRASRDGGVTWGSPIYLALGSYGNYRARALISRYGSGRKWVWEITVTDPIKAILIGGRADIMPEPAMYSTQASTFSTGF